MDSRYLTVSQLTQYIKQKFERDPYLKKVFVKGEISNYNAKRRYKNQYFSLKDDQALISAIIFQSRQSKIRFELEEGMSVLATGWVSVYEKSGNYQLYIDDLQPDGIGALYLAYEQLKEKLSKEGLFDFEHKKPIPRFPKRIGVITSHSGAVIEDIRTTVKRRFPLAQIVLFPTLVQGERAADDIVKNIKALESMSDIDTAIIARGGGSFEDLFPFNEEKVVRAIHDMRTPVISSVGHETDTTLADLVADLRAPTPTAAAEQATPVLRDLLMHLSQLEQRLVYLTDQRLQGLRKQLTRLEQSTVFQQPVRLYAPYIQRLDFLESHLVQACDKQLRQKIYRFELAEQSLKSEHLKQKIHYSKQYLNQMSERLNRSINLLLKNKKQNFIKAVHALDLLSPLKIVTRGYAIAFASDDRPVYSVHDVKKDDLLYVQLKDGEIQSRIEQIDENKTLHDTK